MTDPIPQEVLKRIQEIYDSGENYFEAYDIIAQYADSGSQEWFWFDQAAIINRMANGITPDPSDNQGGTFISVYTALGLRMDGNAVDLQYLTNEVARAAVGSVLLEGGVPSIDTIIKKDIWTAIGPNSGGQTIGGWAGSFYFWDKVYDEDEIVDPITGQETKVPITVGQSILESPYELDKFLTSAAVATMAVGLQNRLDSTNLGGIGGRWGSLDEISATIKSMFNGLGSAEGLPVSLRARIATKVYQISGLQGDDDITFDPFFVNEKAYHYDEKRGEFYTFEALGAGGDLRVYADEETHGLLEQARLAREDLVDSGIGQLAEALVATGQMHLLQVTPALYNHGSKAITWGLEEGYLNPKEVDALIVSTAEDDPNSEFLGVLVKGLINSQDGQCFTGDTSINLWDSSYKPIADIRVGDGVVSRDKYGNLVKGIVTKTFRGQTDEWLKLDFEYQGKIKTITATPGHPFLTPEGDYQPISKLISASGQVDLVMVDGSVVKASVQRIVYSAETAHLYEQVVSYGVAGSAALAPQPIAAWATYNFEVEAVHTYVAENVHVHNRCLENFVSQRTLDALIESGIVDPETHTIIKAGNGQYRILTKEGETVTEGDLKGYPITKAIEVVTDYVKHVGHSFGSVIEDTPEYLSKHLPQLLADVLLGKDLDFATEYYVKKIAVDMGLDVLAKIFGLDSIKGIKLDADGNPTDDFIDTPAGQGLKTMLFQATMSEIMFGDGWTGEDYAQFAANETVKHYVSNFVYQQPWAMDAKSVKQLLPNGTVGFEDIKVPSASGQAAMAGIMSFAGDLLDGGIEDWGAALGSAGIAAGTQYVTTQIIAKVGVETLTKYLGVAAPVFGIVVGQIVGKIFGNLFGGLFTPPPPRFNVQHNDDGTVTVYVASPSGYTYQARDGHDDTLIGGCGHDTLVGSSGDNELHGQDGHDVLNGHGGDDLITGGKGFDVIRGGAG